MPPEPHRPGVSLDQRAALRAAAARLHEHFGSEYSAEMIWEYLYRSYGELAEHAATVAWLPLLAERFARVRMHALARVQGRDQATVPIVLFVCVQNTGRSQIAMGWFRHYADTRAIAWSAGSHPGAELNPAAVEAMAEVGVDISAAFPKPWTEELVGAANIVVTMGCGDECPIYPDTRYESWPVDDPAGMDVTHIRPIRDDIERRVLALLDEMGIDTSV